MWVLGSECTGTKAWWFTCGFKSSANRGLGGEMQKSFTPTLTPRPPRVVDSLAQASPWIPSACEWLTAAESQFLVSTDNGSLCGAVHKRERWPSPTRPSLVDLGAMSNCPAVPGRWTLRQGKSWGLVKEPSKEALCFGARSETWAQTVRLLCSPEKIPFTFPSLSGCFRAPKGL